MLNAKLIVVGGDAKTQEVSLRLPATVGRSKTATLTVPHALVSRVHCEITERNGVLVVKDLQSMNGTYVNNLRIKGEQPLLPGELLTLGNITFRADYGTDQGNEVSADRSQFTAAKNGHVTTSQALAANPVDRHTVSPQLRANFLPSDADQPLDAGSNDRTLSAEDLAAKDLAAKELAMRNKDAMRNKENARPRMNETSAQPGSDSSLPHSNSPTPSAANPKPPSARGASNPKSSADSSWGGASDSSIDFEEIGIASPDKSISLSALGDLPGLRPQVSFIDNLGIPDVHSTADLDPETIQLDIGEKSKSDESVDINALSSFIKKIK